MRKRWATLIAILAMSVLVGCTSTNQKDINKDAAVVITDHIGREVVIEEEPKTIVSGYYITTSMLIALDQDEKLVGIENDGEKRPVYGLSAPEILELPGMGTVKEFNLEKCAELDPDLVILPIKLKDMADALDELGIPVIFVQPESQELLAETIELLGLATGNTEGAEKLNRYIEDKIQTLQTELKESESPSVYLAGNSSFLSTAGPAMYQHTLIANAKGNNVAGELTDIYWAEVSYEQVLAWNPEYIILAADAKYTIEDVLNDASLQGCTAVKNRNVYQIPREIECWDSPVPGSVLGNLWLASVLHPEVYTTAIFEEAVVEYYETFYGFAP